MKNLWKGARKSVFWLNFLEFSELYISKIVIYVMRYIALHYCSQFKKNLIAFGVSYGQKTTQKQPVQWFFAASKTFENS